MLASFFALANAHFQLQFPIPRGPFVEDSEPTFCDGYDDVTSNRTTFPLTGGFFSLNSEHTSWTAGVTLSTKENSTSFNDFSIIVPFFKLSGEGLFCIPLDLSATNATGLSDGLNVTLEIVYDGGDGELYQCADLTLSSTATIPSNVTCVNGTATSSSGSVSATSSATTTPSSSLALRVHGGYLALLLALFVGVAAVAV
ncbi:hypothetical protein DFH07DRAFT_726859 [Mycena maculata]|uniref:Copper acquisition factor BIM1-like domain-containing protein n=1 Tax=Mycena maculata TaxID=230809 RepID=A0AAD7P154_9AGAR|nr:hypothetical protein DFH07DRAFT_726859 [Mycena maculata]